MDLDFSRLLNTIYGLLTVYGLRVIAAIVIFIVGRWVSLMVAKIIERIMLKSKVDETLVSFVRHLSYVGLLAFVVIAALNQLGIQTASFIAVVGAAGLAIGLALQGSLGNFARGPGWPAARSHAVERGLSAGAGIHLQCAQVSPAGEPESSAR